MTWILTVLFIGNSLTYSNNLPATLAAIAVQDGRRIDVQMVAEPNLALIDHLQGQSRALDVLASRKWDFVVLQQGPTTTSIGRDSLVQWTRLFEPYIRERGARPALFMSWTPRARMERMDSARMAFQQAAGAVNGVFLPVGEAWRLALAQDPTITLYDGDDFHPSALGSWLAALVIYVTLFDVDPRALPPVALHGKEKLSVPEATVRLLQRAAHRAIRTYRARDATGL